MANESLTIPAIPADILLVTRDAVYSVTYDLTKGTILLDTKTRPQVLLHKQSSMLAIFVDPDVFETLIKTINSMKGSSDSFGVIEMAKVWRAVKPIIEKMEIKAI